MSRYRSSRSPAMASQRAPRRSERLGSLMQVFYPRGNVVDAGPSASTDEATIYCGPVPQILLALGDQPVVSAGFDATLILWLNLVGTFVFGLSGAIAAVRARFDLFGVITLSAVVGLAGGITRDLLIGVPPATFRDWRYLVAVGAAGLVSYFARPALERMQRRVLIFDAIGLGLFCVTGATKALDFNLGPAQAILLGAITGIGG